MSFIRVGIAMMVFTFSVVIFYFTLSGPVTALFDGFDDADAGSATDELDTNIPIYSSIFNICIAIALAIGPTFFIMWVYHREPDWGYRRY